MAKSINKIRYYNKLVSNDVVSCAIIMIQQKKKQIPIRDKYVSFKVCKIKGNLEFKSTEASPFNHYHSFCSQLQFP